MTLPILTNILSETNIGYAVYSDVIEIPRGYYGCAIVAKWAGATPAVKTFVSGTKATLAYVAAGNDLTFTAASVGTAGNSITVQFLDSVKASVVFQGDLTLQAKAKGSLGNAYTCALVTGGSKGNEIVTEGGGVISVAIQDAAGYSAKTWTSGTFAKLTLDGLSYISKVAGADGNYIQVAYANTGDGGNETASRAGAGTVGNPYVVTVAIQDSAAYTTKTFYSGKRASLVVQDITFYAKTRAAAVYVSIDYDGGGTAGAEVVAVTGTGIVSDPYRIGVTLESGVSTATQVKDALDAAGAPVSNIVTYSITGAGATAQIATIEVPLAGGVDSTINTSTEKIRIVGHGYRDSIRVRVTTPGGALPDPLAAGTDYWVIKDTNDLFQLEPTAPGTGAVNLTDQGAEDVTFSIVPSPTVASEVDAAIAADGDSNTVLTCNVSSASNPQDVTAATPLTGGVSSALSQTAETVTITGHGYVSGTKVTIAGGALPTNLVSPAWIIRVDGATVKFADTYARAMAGTALDLASDGVETTTYTITPLATTLAEVATAINAASAIVDASAAVGAANAVVQTATALAGGLGGAAGSEQVVVSGSDIKEYIETGVSTATQVKTKYDLSAPAVALAACAITGNAGDAQSAAAAITLATGTNNDFTLSTGTPANTITIATHGLNTGNKAVTTTGGTLPTGLSPGGTVYVIKTGVNTFQLASSLANALAGTAIPLTGDGSGSHTLTTAAWGGTMEVEWSVDSAIYESVGSSYGGATVADITAATSKIWTIGPWVQPCYARVKVSPTGGNISTITIDYTIK